MVSIYNEYKMFVWKLLCL